MADYITELRERRVLPAVGVYVASCWTLIEILDRLVERYLLSPYVTDIVFWGLYSLIPAIVLIAWSYGRPGRDKATPAHKVGVPINIIATLGLLITVFGDKDFGAIATVLTVANEAGQQETYIVPRESYRRRMAVFFWENESGDPQLDWLQYGITELLVQDLQQNPFVLASSPWSNFSNGFYPRMQQAGFRDGLNVPRSLMRKIASAANRQYFIEGSFDRERDEFVVTARIWDSQTLEQVSELTSRDWDIYAAIDHLSREVREALDVPAGNRRMVEDLPLAETYGESEDALKAYLEGLNARLFDNDFEASNAFFEEATRLDPNFVLGWFLSAVNLLESGNVPAAQTALAKAQELDYRLPESDRSQLKALSYRFGGEHEKLMSFLRLQVKIRGDASSHDTLATMLMVSGELEEAKKESLAALEKDALNVSIYLRMSTLERATGNMEAAVDYARNYQEQKPQDMEANILLGDLLRDSGDLDSAEEHYKQAQILENATVLPTMRLALIAARKGDVNTARRFVTEAEGLAQLPTDKIMVRQGAALLEARLGKLKEAIRQTYDQEETLRQSQPPFAVAFNIYYPLISYYLDLGETSAARGSLESALGMLEPPLNRFFAFGEAMIQAREKDFTAAEASVERGVAVIEMLQLKVMEYLIPITMAWIAWERSDYIAMADLYLEALDKIEHSVIGSELQIAVPQIYAGLARAQVANGQLEAAARSLANGFRLDPSEPMLWLVKARLQQAQDMPSMALASVNYALAIWQDADEEYIMAGRARTLAVELGGIAQ